MTTFYICRHGQTENNKHQRLSGWLDTPLTEEGEQNALAAAAKIHGTHMDKMVSSDLGRAFTTAYIIARQIGYTGEIERLPAFREVNYGELANQPYAAYPPLSPLENAEFTPSGGESLAQMQRRVLVSIEKIAAANTGKTIFIAGHDGTINAIYAQFKNINIGLADQTHYAHDFIAKFTYENGRIASFEEVL